MTATVNSVREQSCLSQIVLWYRIGLSVKGSYRDWQARAVNSTDRHVAEGAKKKSVLDASTRETTSRSISFVDAL